MNTTTTPASYPVCPGCDCVAGCSRVADKDCLRAVQSPTAQPVPPAVTNEEVWEAADIFGRNESNSDGLRELLTNFLNTRSISQPQQSAAMPEFEVLAHMTENNDGLMFWDSHSEASDYCDDDVEPEKLIRQSDVVAAWAAAINPTGGTT